MFVHLQRPDDALLLPRPFLNPAGISLQASHADSSTLQRPGAPPQKGADAGGANQRHGWEHFTLSCKVGKGLNVSLNLGKRSRNDVAGNNATDSHSSCALSPAASKFRIMLQQHPAPLPDSCWRSWCPCTQHVICLRHNCTVGCLTC